MKKETQTTEFNRWWHNEYLERSGEDANAYGETLFLGCVDDGLPVGDNIVR